MSGIYQIQCDNCDKKYIGQTRRNIKTRFQEHISHIKFQRPEKSAVADHCLKTDHTVSEKNIKILKHITAPKYLNAWESLFINKTKKEDLLNQENGPIQNSMLLSFDFNKNL